MCAAATTARADADGDMEIARAHFATGLTYYDSDRFESAVKEFLESYRLSKRPDLLYNIARSYERMNDVGRAATYYRKFIQARPDAKERREIELVLPNLQRRAATLHLRTTVPGAEVLIDGELIGISPVDAQLVTEGRHHVEVRKVGMVSVEQEVELRGGQITDVRIDPKAAGGDAGEAAKAPETDKTLVPSLFEPGTTAPAASGPAKAERSPTLVAPPPEAPRRRWLVPTLVVVGVVAVAAVVAILATTLGGIDYSARARAMCSMSNGMGCLLLDGGN